MRPKVTVLEHPAARRRSRLGGLGSGLLLAAAIITGGTLVTIAAMLLVVLAAPLVAALVAWLAWRGREGSGRRPPSRFRSWRRARALRLVVLPGAPQHATLRAVR
jgi:hypothetical protein